MFYHKYFTKKAETEKGVVARSSKRKLADEDDGNKSGDDGEADAVADDGTDDDSQEEEIWKVAPLRVSKFRDELTINVM
jgi:hypothetical protein